MEKEGAVADTQSASKAAVERHAAALLADTVIEKENICINHKCCSIK